MTEETILANAQIAPPGVLRHGSVVLGDGAPALRGVWSQGERVA